MFTLAQLPSNPARRQDQRRGDDAASCSWDPSAECEVTVGLPTSLLRGQGKGEEADVAQARNDGPKARASIGRQPAGKIR